MITLSLIGDNGASSIAFPITPYNESYRSCRHGTLHRGCRPVREESLNIGCCYGNMRGGHRSSQHDVEISKALVTFSTRNGIKSCATSKDVNTRCSYIRLFHHQPYLENCNRTAMSGRFSQVHYHGAKITYKQVSDHATLRILLAVNWGPAEEKLCDNRSFCGFSYSSVHKTCCIIPANKSPVKCKVIYGRGRSEWTEERSERLKIE